MGLSYGEILFYGGLSLSGVSLLLLIIFSIIFGLKRKAIKKHLFDKYGF
ncbi:MAG: hypothetical protein K5989_12750 [Lachnospiraceae bacterium]|nr:hypothetical protein [Lachnospiraceae bacterium]